MAEVVIRWCTFDVITHFLAHCFFDFENKCTKILRLKLILKILPVYG